MLRLVKIEWQPLWTDEALTLALAQWPAGDLLFRPVDATGGLYYVLHKLFVPDDSGLAGIRAISVVFGTLSIPAIYVVGRLAVGRPAGVLAAALLALSPMAIDYSQEARAYALQLFLILASAGGLLAWAARLGRGGGTGALIVFAVATVLAFSTHLSGAFWVLPAVPLALVVTLERGTASQKRAFFLALCAMAVGALPEMVRLVWRASLGGGFVWLKQPGPTDALATWAEVILPGGGLIATPLSTLLVGAIALALVWRLAVRRAEVRAWASRSPAAAGTIVILLVAPVGVWLFGFLLVPIFMARTILMAVAGFILLICLVASFERRPTVGIGAVLLFALSLLATGPVRAKEDWGGVAATLRATARPGDVVLHCTEWKFPAFRHAAAAPNGSANLVLLGNRMILFDQPDSGAGSWKRAYFRTAVEPPLRHVMGQRARLPIEEAELPPFRRAWLVESECTAPAMAATRHWLGAGNWHLEMTAPATAHHAGIRLWRFDSARPSERPIYSVTN